jgi:hypothetical protein
MYLIRKVYPLSEFAEIKLLKFSRSVFCAFGHFHRA